MMIIYIIIRLFANTFVGLMLQVHKPSDPLQPDLMYFLFPRKCGVFGMCSDGIPQQVNYLIDEGHWGSNGSNAGISYLHHLFSKYGLGENYVPLHCDCSGQNTNKYMMWYGGLVLHGGSPLHNLPQLPDHWPQRLVWTGVLSFLKRSSIAHQFHAWTTSLRLSNPAQ